MVGAGKTTIEQTTLRLVAKAGEKGILQSKLCKKIAVDSRRVSQIMARLESKRMIKREREMHNGRWTYRVVAEIKPPEFRNPKVGSLIGVPCASCKEDDKCSTSGIITPEKCDSLTRWLMKLAAAA